MEGNIADLIIGLEDATNVFGAEFESMKSYTGWEKFIGIFSKQRMQRMRSERVRNMSLAGNLQELLLKSDKIIGILKSQKGALESRYKASETFTAKGFGSTSVHHGYTGDYPEAHRGVEPDAA